MAHLMVLLAAFLHFYSHFVPHVAYLSGGDPTAAVYRTTAWAAGGALVSITLGLWLLRRSRHGALRLFGLLVLIGLNVVIHGAHVSDSNPGVLAGGAAALVLVFLGSFERIAATVGLVLTLLAHVVVSRRWEQIRPDDSANWVRWAVQYEHLVLGIAAVIAAAGSVLSVLGRDTYDEYLNEAPDVPEAPDPFEHLYAH